MPKHFPKTHRYFVYTLLCRLYKLNARIGRLSLDEPDDEETLHD